MAPEIRVLKPRQVDANKQVILSYPRQVPKQRIHQRNDADALPFGQVNSAQSSPVVVNLPEGGEAISLQNIAAAEPVKPPTSQRLALNDLVLPNPPQLHQKVQLDDQFLFNLNGVNQAFPAQYVGSLAVVWRSDLEQFHLLTCPEGEPLSSNRFATFEHCFSAAVELEQTFAMAEAIVLRSSETWEAIPSGTAKPNAQVIRQHWLREQVELSVGAK